MSATIEFRRATVISAASETWYLCSDGDVIYRGRNSVGYYYIDYSDDGGSTWELALVSIADDEDHIIININSNPAGYRQVVRDNDYCIDHELDATGFAGSEGTNWENVYKIIK